MCKGGPRTGLGGGSGLAGGNCPLSSPRGFPFAEGLGAGELRKSVYIIRMQSVLLSVNLLLARNAYTYKCLMIAMP